MPRPRRQTDETALFVRIPSIEAEKLQRAASALGAPKRELITRLVARYVDPEDPATLSRLGGPGAELSVRRAWFRPVEAVCHRMLRTSHAAPSRGCECGIHAGPTLEAWEHYLAVDSESRVFGRVLLWGSMLEGTEGWRAAFARRSRSSFRPLSRTAS